MNYFVLLGVLIVVAGFALRLNPMLVVTAAAIATGLIAGMDLAQVISTFGKAFNDNRIIAIVWIVLPVIGLLERYGLQQRAAAVIRKMKAATVGRLLIVYLLFRQGTAALGLISIAGHPQTVRPLVAPMALAAAEERHGALDEDTAETVKAYSAATDNVGLFFGEDIFIAIGSIILIQQTLSTYGIMLAPFELAVWAIPTAVLAFVIHGTRLLMLDRRLASLPRSGGEGGGGGSASRGDADSRNRLRSSRRPKGGAGVADEASAITPPPRSAGPPSPSGDGEARS